MANCYGITSLEHTFDFSNNNMPVALYAPNGMMKTSLAKSIKNFIDGQIPKDLIFPSKESELSITDELNSLVNPESIFVIDSINEKYQSNRISTLLASNDLKVQYEAIYKEIGKKRDILLSKLKKFSGISKDIDLAFTRDYQLPRGDFLTALARLEKEVTNQSHAEYGEFKYQTIFNDKVEKFTSNKDFENLIADYTEAYERILDNSKYFKKGVFNHSNAETISKTLKANGWFQGGHSVRLNDGAGSVDIANEKDLTKAIETEKEAILSDDTLKNMFSKVDKALSNAELKAFREYLIENPALVADLKDAQYLKNKIWIGYLIKAYDDYSDLIKTYEESEVKLKEILAKAEAETTRWEGVIDIFNKRFSVPFSVRIENKGDAVLNLNSPQIAFYFDDVDGAQPKKVNRDLLDSVLSNGEKRALYILNIIFEVVAREESGIETVFIIDDIADSFDYKNKYAIVEYLWFMKEVPTFHLLVMTHNFDFYRTIVGRLGVHGDNKLIASKSEDKILLSTDNVGGNPFANWKKNLDNDRYLIASIPFVRNLAEYTGKDDVFSELTALLHIKENTSTISINDLKSSFNEILSDDSTDAIKDSEDFILDKIFKVCGEILGDDNEDIQLEDKIVLSIGIRLSAEKLLIELLTDKSYAATINSGQTFKLIKKYRKQENSDESVLDLMNQVQLMTPENIHLNSFMFEPILDMSVHHLKALYTESSEKLTTLSS